MRALVSGLLFLLLAVAAYSGASAEDAAPGRSCAAVTADMAAARQAGDLDKLAALWTEASASATGCDEQALYCLGESAALAQVEAAYAKADAGASAGDMTSVLDKALTYGSPWQLRVARGDIELDRARAGHNRSGYSNAALDYQEALIAIGEPVVCAAYGEAARPVAAEIAPIYHRMTTALLLASPVRVATTRCAPCQWLFIAGVAGFAPDDRPLPITFASDSAVPTREGEAALAALIECIKGSGYTRIVLSGHTDERGSAPYNLALSERRLETVRKDIVAAGYTGEVAIEPKGKSEPFVTDGAGYSAAEVRQLNRRIDLREATPDGTKDCS